MWMYKCNKSFFINAISLSNAPLCVYVMVLIGWLSDLDVVQSKQPRRTTDDARGTAASQHHTPCRPRMTDPLTHTQLAHTCTTRRNAIEWIHISSSTPHRLFINSKTAQSYTFLPSCSPAGCPSILSPQNTTPERIRGKESGTESAVVVHRRRR